MRQLKKLLFQFVGKLVCFFFDTFFRLAPAGPRTYLLIRQLHELFLRRFLHCPARTRGIWIHFTALGENSKGAVYSMGLTNESAKHNPEFPKWTIPKIQFYTVFSSPSRRYFTIKYFHDSARGNEIFSRRQKSRTSARFNFSQLYWRYETLDGKKYVIDDRESEYI